MSFSSEGQLKGLSTLLRHSVSRSF